MNRIKQLEEEIAKQQEELNRLKEAESSKGNAIKLLSEYTNEEKIKKFDSLYKSAESMLESGRDDDKQYTWEAVMSLLAKDHNEFWKYYNSKHF